MNAYERLNILGEVQIDESFFNRLVRDFQEEYLADRNYFDRIEIHRYPNDLKNEVLSELYDELRKIQYRDEMRDVDAVKNSFGYVPSKVIEIWKSDRRLKSCYNSIANYCSLRTKDFLIVAMHMAEYKALSKLARKLSRELHSPNHKKNKPMPKNFEIEIRETFEKPYLKVFLRNELDHKAVATVIEGLHSVRRANVTEQRGGKKDLTIYPQKAYGIDEVQQEIELALKNFFNGNPIDPSFMTETISSMSDKAYFQIIDYVLLLGKNLEAFKELNVRFDEERYRDYFLPFLNAISTQHAAKGEVFNRSGKTDILVFDNKGNNIFIAECKLWKGEAYLLEAVEQLLKNYINWRDEKTAIIIFNRDVKNFKELIETATTALSKHELCLKDFGNRKDTSYSYLFRNPNDEQKTIQLELILFNFS